MLIIAVLTAVYLTDVTSCGLTLAPPSSLNLLGISQCSLSLCGIGLPGQISCCDLNCCTGSNMCCSPSGSCVPCNSVDDDYLCNSTSIADPTGAPISSSFPTPSPSVTPSSHPTMSSSAIPTVSITVPPTSFPTEPPTFVSAELNFEDSITISGIDLGNLNAAVTDALKDAIRTAASQTTQLPEDYYSVPQLSEIYHVESYSKLKAAFSLASFSHVLLAAYGVTAPVQAVVDALLAADSSLQISTSSSAAELQDAYSELLHSDSGATFMRYFLAIVAANPLLSASIDVNGLSFVNITNLTSVPTTAAPSSLPVNSPSNVPTYAPSSLSNLSPVTDDSPAVSVGGMVGIVIAGIIVMGLLCCVGLCSFEQSRRMTVSCLVVSGACCGLDSFINNPLRRSGRISRRIQNIFPFGNDADAFGVDINDVMMERSPILYDTEEITTRSNGKWQSEDELHDVVQSPLRFRDRSSAVSVVSPVQPFSSTLARLPCDSAPTHFMGSV
jgi:hypothetical protein